MIRRAFVRRFKKFEKQKFELKERILIAGPNNSGKTTLLQALATWAELGEIWIENGRDLARKADKTFYRVDLDVAAFRTVALSSFDELWWNQDTREDISIRVATDDWDVGFDMRYEDSKVATVGPLTEISESQLERYMENPLRALYIPSLSGMDVKEPEYGRKVLAARLAHGKGGTVIRNLIQAVSQESVKWGALLNSVNEFFGYELSTPSGTDPIVARYRHSEKEHWYDLINGASGFLQTVLIKSALLHSSARLFLLDEPDAHLHALLKEKMYRLIREHCDKNGCQAVIATHSGRLIEEAGAESGEKLFLVTEKGLNPVSRQDAKELLKISTQNIVHAETFQRVLYLEGKSDLDILREWARVLDHPAVRWLENPFWIPTAEEDGRSFVQKHFRALKAQVPTLRALEIRDRNGSVGVRTGQGKKRDGFLQEFWNRYEIENYLIHPKAIARFVLRSRGKEKKEKVERYMKEQWPPVLSKKPFEDTRFDQVKGKSTIIDVMTAAGVDMNRVDMKESECYRIARAMKPGEIHPDVVVMLDRIEDQVAIEK